LYLQNYCKHFYLNGFDVMSKNKIAAIAAAVASVRLKNKANDTTVLQSTELDAHITTQELVQNTSIIELKPEHCAPWGYHNRDMAWLNSDNCKDLITSISKVGQQSPILVRKSKPNSSHKYDVIYGVRRWFACSQISEQKLLAKVTTAGDRECMILMHIENADSKDISDFERAYSFRANFKSGLFSSQNDFAEAMNISNGMVTKLFTAAELADNPWFDEFVTNKVEVPLIKAYKIAASLRNNFTRMFVDKEISIFRECLKKNNNTISTKKFISFLENIIFRNDTEKKNLLNQLSTKNSNFKVKLDTKKQLTVQIKSKLEEQQAKELIAQALEVYYEQ